jgi:hypothetical protein
LCNSSAVGLTRRSWAAALVAVGATLLLPAGAASDSQPIADLAVTLSGPSDGAVGDVLTYTATVTNNGPDAFDLATSADLVIGYETDGGLKFLDTDARCGATSAGPTLENASCAFTAPLAPGEVFIVHARYQVLERLGSRLQAFSILTHASDPEPGNNAATLQVLPPAALKISNTEPPTLNGVAAVGETLTATSGSWSPAWPYTTIYNWSRCTPDLVACVGTDGPSAYTVTSNDVGCRISLIVEVSSGLDGNRGFKGATPLHTDPVPGGTCNPGAGPLFTVSGGSQGGGGGAAGGSNPPAASGNPAGSAAPAPHIKPGCTPGYAPCLPNIDGLDCSQIPAEKRPVRVTGADPYGLDRERDGVGCYPAGTTIGASSPFGLIIRNRSEKEAVVAHVGESLRLVGWSPATTTGRGYQLCVSRVGGSRCISAQTDKLKGRLQSLGRWTVRSTDAVEGTIRLTLRIDGLVHAADTVRVR